jgi:glyoxylase-like metal-dependent hydrolase (beta-lactamase superfamily II)
MAVRSRRHASVEQLTAGRRVFGVLPVRSHCYRVGSVLIDGGAPNQAQALLDALDTEVTDVLLTHAHEDHVGLAACLAERGARVLAPEPVLPMLADPPGLPGYRERSWGTPRPVEAQPLDSAVETPEGRFAVVDTPGHSPHHVALVHREEGWLFTGDAFLGARDYLRFDEDLERELASLERLAELEADTLFPGHGSVREEPTESIRRSIDWHRDRAREAWALRRDGASLGAVRRELFGFEGPLAWFSGGEFSKANLARALLRLPPDEGSARGPSE